MEYSYLGYTEDRRVIRGRINAQDEQAASNLLSSMGYNILSLKPVSKFSINMTLFRSRVKPMELVTFARQLALLLESGVNIIHCLELMRDQTADAELRRTINEIIPDLKAGTTLSEAMSKHTNVFSRMFSRLIEVGERTGSLDVVLKNLADHIEKESRSMAKVKNALTYPTIVFILAIIVGFILVTFVLPPIVSMFSSLGGQLPLITRILIAGVDFFKTNILAIIGTIGAVVLLTWIYVRTPGGNMVWNRLKLRIPLLGRISHVSELARICRSMSLLFRSGIAVNEIINLSVQTCGNKVIAKALTEVGQEALQGRGLAGPMKKRDVFLPLMTELTAVGEETGNLEETLLMIAENFETEADIKTQRLLSLIEPVMTITMGLVVAFLAMSIFLPLYSSLQYVK